MNFRESGDRFAIRVQRDVAQDGVNQRSESCAAWATQGLLDGMNGHFHLEIGRRIAGFARGEDIELPGSAGGAHFVARFLPGVIRAEARGFDIARRENFVAPKSQVGGRPKIQGVWIPPDHGMHALLRRV